MGKFNPRRLSLSLLWVCTALLLITPSVRGVPDTFERENLFVSSAESHPWLTKETAEIKDVSKEESLVWKVASYLTGVIAPVVNVFANPFSLWWEKEKENVFANPFSLWWEKEKEEHAVESDIHNGVSNAVNFHSDGIRGSNTRRKFPRTRPRITTDTEPMTRTTDIIQNGPSVSSVRLLGIVAKVMEEYCAASVVPGKGDTCVGILDEKMRARVSNMEESLLEQLFLDGAISPSEQNFLERLAHHLPLGTRGRNLDGVQYMECKHGGKNLEDYKRFGNYANEHKDQDLEKLMELQWHYEHELQHARGSLTCNKFYEDYLKEISIQSGFHQLAHEIKLHLPTRCQFTICPKLVSTCKFAKEHRSLVKSFLVTRTRFSEMFGSHFVKAFCSSPSFIFQFGRLNPQHVPTFKLLCMEKEMVDEGVKEDTVHLQLSEFFNQGVGHHFRKPEMLSTAATQTSPHLPRLRHWISSGNKHGAKLQTYRRALIGKDVLWQRKMKVHGDLYEPTLF